MNYHEELKQRQTAYEAKVDEIKSKLGDQEAAKIADDLVELKTLGKSYATDLGELYDKNEATEADNKEIMLQNGKLLRRIEAQDFEIENEKSDLEQKKQESVVSLDDVVSKEGKALI